MIVTFEEDYLKTMYETGKTDKKHRYQPEVVRGYQKGIKMMTRVADIATLSRINSLNYEELKGDKKGISSIRANLQYRIEFTVRNEGIESIVTICNILELSNHYK